MSNMKKFLRTCANFVLGAISVLAIWYIAYLIIDSHVLSNPFAALRAVPGLMEHNILTHAYHSAFRVFAAMLISMFIGLTVGICAAGKHLPARILSPFLYFTYPIPRVALLPVVLLIFGLTDTSKIIMITLIVVYPIIVVVRDNVRAIPKQTYNTLICYGASKTQLFFYATLPWAVSGILSTARITLGTAISILFFTETYGGRHGMGFFIMDSWMRLNYVQMYAGIIALSAAGFILFLLIDVLESVLLKWRKVVDL